MFVLTETVLPNFGDFLLRSVNFDCDYLRYKYKYFGGSMDIDYKM